MDKLYSKAIFSLWVCVCPCFYLKNNLLCLSILISHLLDCKTGCLVPLITLVWERILKTGCTGGAALQALQLAQPLAAEGFQGTLIKSLQARLEWHDAVTQSLFHPSEPGITSTSTAGLVWASVKSLIKVFLLQSDKQEQYFLYLFLCLEDGVETSPAFSWYVGRTETRRGISRDLIEVQQAKIKARVEKRNPVSRAKEDWTAQTCKDNGQ